MEHAPHNSGSAYTPGPRKLVLYNRITLAYQIKPLETWVALSMSSQVQFLAESPEVRPGKFTDKSSMNKLFQT